jgi:hypothetical protein
MNYSGQLKQAMIELQEGTFIKHRWVQRASHVGARRLPSVAPGMPFERA